MIRDEVVTAYVRAYRDDDYDALDALIPMMSGPECRAAMSRLGLGHIL